MHPSRRPGLVAFLAIATFRGTVTAQEPPKIDVPQNSETPGPASVAPTEPPHAPAADAPASINADAGASATPPPAPDVEEAVAYAGGCSVSECSSLETCIPASTTTVRAAACWASVKGKTCIDAITAVRARAKEAGYVLDAGDDDIIREFYSRHYPKDISCPFEPPSALQSGWLNNAIILSPRSYRLGGLYRWGVQVLPSLAVGIPFGISNPDGEASNALNGTTVIGGAAVRVSPIGFYASILGFVGTTSVGADANLDAMKYKSPALLLYGAGFDVLGGFLSLTYVKASLKKNGLFSSTGDSITYAQFGIDFSTLAFTAAGAARASDPK